MRYIPPRFDLFVEGIIWILLKGNHTLRSKRSVLLQRTNGISTGGKFHPKGTDLKENRREPKCGSEHSTQQTSYRAILSGRDLKNRTPLRQADTSGSREV